MLDQIFCISVSHKRAPLGVREALARQREDLVQLRATLIQAFDEAVVLSTCGRFEIYLAASASDGDWADVLPLPHEALEKYSIKRIGSAVAQHVLAVASGLDSPLLGEDHVLGQVRDAFLAADSQGTVGPLLSALFRAAIACGRRVRRETRMTDLAPSYAGLAMEALPSSLAHDDRVLIVGSGRLACEAGDGLLTRGQTRVEIVSRHERRGRELANALRGDWYDWERLPERLGEASVAICCTAARQPVVTPGMVSASKMPKLIIDMGMPRNVDQRMAGHVVQVVDLDALAGASWLTESVLAKAAEIVEVELHRYVDWLARRSHVLRGKVEIRDGRVGSLVRDEAAA